MFLKTFPFKDHITHSPKNTDTKKEETCNEDQKLAILLSSTPWYVHVLSNTENKFDTAGNDYKLEKMLMVSQWQNIYVARLADEQNTVTVTLSGPT